MCRVMDEQNSNIQIPLIHWIPYKQGMFFLIAKSFLSLCLYEYVGPSKRTIHQTFAHSDVKYPSVIFVCSRGFLGGTFSRVGYLQ